MESWIVENARLLNPEAEELSAPRSLYIEDGRVCAAPPANARHYDARGRVLAPGLVDLHVHFRDPGQTAKEDIRSGSEAAAAGGVTGVVCMANTTPVLDTPEGMDYVYRTAQGASCRVYPVGAVSVGERGEQLTDFSALARAGAVAFSDDGKPIGSAALMREALVRAKALGKLVLVHSEDASLTDGRPIHEGEVSARLGLPGRPAVAESYMVARDAMLAESVGAAVHIQHISTADSIEIVRQAQRRGVAVSCETCPHYFFYTQARVEQLGTRAKMFPPLRTQVDREAVCEGLRDGTIAVIATDHAPHTAEEKARSLLDAPGGAVGLETSLAASLTALVRPGVLTLPQLWRKLSLNPARLLGLPHGGLRPGDPADFVLFDPDEAYTVTPAHFRSRGRATPFEGERLFGTVYATFLAGRLVFARS